MQSKWRLDHLFLFGIVLCGIHFVTSCFGNVSLPCTFPIKQPVNWSELNSIERVRASRVWTDPSLFVLCPCLSPSVCLTVCCSVNRKLSGDTFHPLAPRLEVCSWQEAADAILYLLYKWRFVMFAAYPEVCETKSCMCPTTACIKYMARTMWAPEITLMCDC